MDFIQHIIYHSQYFSVKSAFGQARLRRTYEILILSLVKMAIMINDDHMHSSRRINLDDEYRV